MKRSVLLHMVLALAAVVSISCKKDDEETVTLPYLYGVDFDMPVFARPGDSFTLKPYGVYYTSGEGVETYEYKWKINSDDYSDPMDTFTFTVNEVGNYTIYCQASDPDGNYYACSTSKLLIVIDPALGKTLTGTDISATDAHISDSRDKVGENEYFYIRKGNLDWFRNNLAWTGAGVAYECSDVTSYPLGRYYTWNEAIDACPDGWRLPTDEEWESLGGNAGTLSADAYLNNYRMWEYWPQITRTNATGMSVIPAGYTLVGKSSPSFKRLYDYAAFWTATESASDPSQARYRYIYVEEEDVKATYGDKASLALSVRCVR